MEDEYYTYELNYDREKNALVIAFIDSDHDLRKHVRLTPDIAKELHSQLGQCLEAIDAIEKFINAVPVGWRV